jgi:hypothetical protein
MTDLLNADQFPPRTAGLRGARESHEPRLLLSNFLHEGTELAIPNDWDGTHGITDWGMDFNDTKSDCGAAAVDHGFMAKNGDKALYDTLGKPKYDGTLPTYYAYGISQGEPGPEPDEGVENASWLAFLYKEGIIDGYGEVPLNQLRQYAMAFGGLLMACTLSDNAEAEFEAHTAWGQSDDVPDQNEGHDIYYVLFSSDGTAKVITWGALQEVTEDFITRFVTDAWAFLTEEDAKRVGVNWRALQEMLSEVHGVPGTVEPMPEPEPSPEPKPVPSIPAIPSNAFIEKVEEMAREEAAKVTEVIEDLERKFEAEKARLLKEVETILAAAKLITDTLPET